ncbi:MAG: hypothetical protein IIA85_02265, partial [Nanoarchaeota archaeon]|nr:hypothetical protein [Nanoarchaeota archaeon]
MRAKSLTLSFFSIFIVAMLAVFVSAATIFSDDFDDGNLDGWTATGWTPDTGGTYAESNNQVGAILSRIVSTSGFQSIVVSYDRQLADSWETDNNFTVSWSVDGTTFTPLESVVGSGSGTPNDT